MFSINTGFVFGKDGVCMRFHSKRPREDVFLRGFVDPRLVIFRLFESSKNSLDCIG